MTFETKRRALVVEDDPIVAMVVEDTLRNMGLDVLIDLNLIDALSEIEASEFDVALIDLGLRGESARPVILALLDRSIPFVVMSGGDLRSLAVEFPQIRTISKPLDMKALKQLMLELLGALPDLR